MSDRLEERLARLAGSTATPDLEPTLLYCRRLPERAAEAACTGCPVAHGLMEATVHAALGLPERDRKGFSARWWCHKNPKQPCRGMLDALKM